MSFLDSALDTVLNKGGAGFSMSRADTITAVNPVLEQHARLNHAYEQAAARLAGRPIAQQLHAHQRVARMDVGKLSETVLSAGGTPYTGTDVEPGSEPLPEDDDVLRYLADRERNLLDAIEHELARGHMIRTTAILALIQTHSRERLTLVERAAQKPQA